MFKFWHYYFFVRFKLREKFKEEMQNAMKSKDGVKLSTLRFVLAAIKDRDLEYRSKGNGDKIPDSNILEILSKMVKQRNESIVTFKKAKRNDLVEQEEKEIKVISEFLPKKLSSSELKDIIEDVINKTDAVSLRDLGKVMAEIKNKYAGRCDLAEVSNTLRKRLGG